MVIVVTRKDEKMVVSINEETLICTYKEQEFATLTKLSTEDLQKCTSMADAIVIADNVRSIVAGIGNSSERNYMETACKDHIVFDPNRGTYHLKSAKGDIQSKVPLPKVFVEKILVSIEKGIDPSPIIKSCIRFFRNRNLTVSKLKKFVNYIDYKMIDHDLLKKLITDGYKDSIARELASYNQTPITLEGLMCTYKVSKEIMDKYALDDNGNKILVPRYGKTIDEITGEISTNMPEFVEDRLFLPAVQGRNGDAFTTEYPDGRKIKDHLYIVGNVHYLDDWNQVNCHDDQSCVKGLHFGNLDYIRGYESKDTVTHNCFIDPSHIGAFTDDGSGAVRCIQGMIHSSKQGNNKGIYFSSNYASRVDSEWEDLKAEAILHADQVLEELTKADRDNLAHLYMF